SSNVLGESSEPVWSHLARRMALTGRRMRVETALQSHSRRILDDRAMRGLYPCPIEGASFQYLFSHRGLLVRGRSQQFFVNGSGLTLPSLKMAISAPPWGWRRLGRTSLFCVRGVSHDTAPTGYSCRRV